VSSLLLNISFGSLSLLSYLFSALIQIRADRISLCRLGGPGLASAVTFMAPFAVYLFSSGLADR
jgi:hypothetical protein